MKKNARKMLVKLTTFRIFKDFFNAVSLIPHSTFVANIFGKNFFKRLAKT